MVKAYLQLHLAVILAGFTAILGKLISLSAAPLVWWRLFFTVLFLFLLFLFHKKPLRQPQKLTKQLLFIGVLVGLHWYCFFACIKYSSVSLALICLSASGLFSAIIQPLVYRVKPVLIELFFGLLCMVGIYTIFKGSGSNAWGLLLGLGSALMASCFSIMNKSIMSNRINPLLVTFWEMTGALALTSLLALITLPNFPTGFLPMEFDWLWILILALLCSVLAFFLQLQALKQISAATLNMTYNLEPVYGILLASLIFKENRTMGWAFWIGFLIIGLAVAGQMWVNNRAYKKIRESASF